MKFDLSDFEHYTPVIYNSDLFDLDCIDLDCIDEICQTPTPTKITKKMTKKIKKYQNPFERHYENKRCCVFNCGNEVKGRTIYSLKFKKKLNKKGYKICDKCYFFDHYKWSQMNI